MSPLINATSVALTAVYTTSHSQGIDCTLNPSPLPAPGPRQATLDIKGELDGDDLEILDQLGSIEPVYKGLANQDNQSTMEQIDDMFAAGLATSCIGLLPHHPC
jgi:hypothetical protein